MSPRKTRGGLATLHYLLVKGHFSPLRKKRGVEEKMEGKK